MLTLSRNASSMYHQSNAFNMPKNIFSLALFSALLLLSACVSTEDKQQDKLLRHVVLFKFADTASRENVKKVEDAFAALPAKISLIKDYEWGTNSSPENLNNGLTHCFFVTFASNKDRDA